MNVLFLTIGRFESIESHSIYADLLRCFRDEGHVVYTITPYEKRIGKKTDFVHENGAHVLHVLTGNVTGASNLINKGMAQMSIESIYIKAIKKYLTNIRFDLVLYSTPPITFCKVVEFIKRRDGAKSYLLLKDIFPQNAVDLGMISQNGIKGLVYKYFRNKEKKLYLVSDFIGCMSKANEMYLLKHNSNISPEVLDICPNAIEIIDKSVDIEKKIYLRNKYGIPMDKIVFIYGGNLGRPQGIPFMIECLKRVENDSDVFFLIIGSGTEYNKIDEYISENRPDNIMLLNQLPKDDYDSLVGVCDVGLIFLDHRFTIPNFPSRLLAYMQAKIPVLACTDPNTDIGDVIKSGGFGWWCESDDTNQFKEIINQIKSENLDYRGKVAFEYLEQHYSSNMVYKTIMARIN